MAYFVKKTVMVEAVQVKATDFNGETWDGCPFSDAPAWLTQAIVDGRISVQPSDLDYALWKISTLEDGPNGEAIHIASPGDWIIKGVKGELYPCKPDIFEQTYRVAFSLDGDVQSSGDPDVDALVVAADILEERRRQRAVEGWTIENDDEHERGELAFAAATYALQSACYEPDRDHLKGSAERHWPFAISWFKPKDQRRDLVRAAALIIAEIERIDRAAAKAGA